VKICTKNNLNISFTHTFVLIFSALIFISCKDNDNVISSGNPVPKDIYYSKLSTPDTNGAVYTISKDGSGNEKITGSGIILSPPYKNKILTGSWSSFSYGFTHLYSLNTDGTNMKEVTPGFPMPIYFQMSPDASKILLLTAYGFSLEVMNTDGSGLTHISDNVYNGCFPDFSPDSRWIAYFSGYSGTYANLFKSKADGTQTVFLKDMVLVFADVTLDWSPDCSKIVFEDKDSTNRTGIYTINTDGSGYIKIYGNTNSSRNTNPEWSPDGSKIVFLTQYLSQKSNLTVCNSDGTREYSINDAEAYQIHSFHWSPDSRLILYVTDNKMKYYDTGNRTIYNVTDFSGVAFWDLSE
jgi:Tol biopolymer transport system component